LSRKVTVEGERRVNLEATHHFEADEIDERHWSTGEQGRDCRAVCGLVDPDD
jgi:hypothetical protein